MAQVRLLVTFHGGAPPAGKTPHDIAGMIHDSHGVSIRPVADVASPWCFEAMDEADAMLLINDTFKLSRVPFSFVRAAQPTPAQPVYIGVIGEGDAASRLSNSDIVTAVAATYGAELTPLIGRPLVFSCTDRAIADTLFEQPTLIRGDLFHFVEEFGVDDPALTPTSHVVDTDLAGLSRMNAPPPPYEPPYDLAGSADSGVGGGKTLVHTRQVIEDAPLGSRSGSSTSMPGRDTIGDRETRVAAADETDNNDADEAGDDDDDEDSDDDADLPRKVHIFHNAETCFVPNDDSINGSILYDNVLREVLRLHLPPARQGDAGNVDINQLVVRWTLVLRRAQANSNHIGVKTLEQLQDHSVTHVSPMDTQGSADMKIKDDLLQFLDDRRGNSHAQRRRTLVVLMIGDCDYSLELHRLRHERYPCVIVHRGIARSVCLDIARVGQRPMDSGRWDALVSAARAEPRPLDESGPAPPGLSDTPVTLAQAETVLYERRIGFQVQLFLSQFTAASNEMHARINIHPSLALKMVPAGRPTAARLTLQMDLARPSEAVIAEAIAAMDKFFDETVRQEIPLDIEGVAPEVLRRNAVVREEARRHDVFLYIPKGHDNLMAASELPSAPNATTGSNTHFQFCTPVAWKEDDLKRFCSDHHNLTVFKADRLPLPAKAKAIPANATYSWWAVKLDYNRHPANSAARSQLVTELVDRPPIKVGDVSMSFRRTSSSKQSTASAGAPSPSARLAKGGSASRTASVTLITLNTPDADRRLHEIRQHLLALAKGKRTIVVKDAWKFHLLRNVKTPLARPQVGDFLKHLARQLAVTIDLSAVSSADLVHDPPAPSPRGSQRSGRGGRSQGPAQRVSERNGAGRGGGSQEGQSPGGNRDMPAPPNPSARRPQQGQALQIIVAGPVRSVLDAMAAIDRTLQGAVLLTVSIPTAKWRKPLLEMLNETRQEILSPQGDGAGLGTLRGDGGDTLGASQSSLNIVVPSFDARSSSGEIHVSALPDDAADAREAKEALEKAINRFSVATVPIPPTARVDVSPEACGRLMTDFHVHALFNASRRELELAGSSDDLEDARTRINQLIQGSVDTVSPFEIRDIQLARLVSRWPSMAQATISEAQRLHPAVHITNKQENGSRGWRVSGPRAAVEAALAFLKTSFGKQAQLMATATVPLTPAQQAYVSSTANKQLRSLADKAVVVARLETGAGSAGDGGSGSSSSNTGNSANARPASSRSAAVVELGSGTIGKLTVKVIHGDFLKISASAIVNPANKDLGNEGGLSGAIARAAGPALKTACDRLRPLRDGEAKVSQAFDLVKSSPGPYTHVVHTVAPIKVTGTVVELQVLREAASSAVRVAAATAGVTSLAIPVIGSGIFGWDVNASANEIVYALRAFAASSSATYSKLTEVILFDNRAEAARAFVVALTAAVAGGSQAAVSGGGTISPAPAPVPTPTLPTHQWEWLNDKHTYTPYDYDQNAQIERAFARLQRREPGAPMLVRVTGDVHGNFSDSKHILSGYAHAVYDVDLVNMKQINASSLFQRDVRRRPLQVGELPPNEPPSLSQPTTSIITPFFRSIVAAAFSHLLSERLASVAFSSKNSTTAAVSSVSPTSSAPLGCAIHLYGQAPRVALAKKLVTDMLASALGTLQRDVDDVIEEPLPKIVAQLGTLVEKFGATVELVAGTRKVVLRAYGKDALALASAQMADKLAQMVSDATKVKYPPEWDMTSNVLLHTVHPNSSEYAQMTRQFNSGFPATVVKLERVQNKTLWQYYYDRRRQVMRENGGKANEKYLKHGTRTTQPSTLYDGIYGIDVRYGRDGYYGQAAYFAEKTTYSHAYCYSPPTLPGHGQMFMALVARGRVHDRTAEGVKPDPTIKHPPAGYHSIRAMVKEDDPAIMTYENHQAYPAYLVTYRLP